MKKVVSLLLALAMLLALCACSNGTRAEQESPKPNVDNDEPMVEVTPPPADTDRLTTANSEGIYPKLTVAISSEPTSMTPNTGSNSSEFIFMVYECLFDLVNGEYVPSVAKNYTVVDATHWDVELWDNVTDSAGNKITADDVVASYDWLVSTGQLTKYDLFDKVEKTGEYTLRFTFKSEPVAINALEYILCRTFILDSTSFESGDLASGAPGTGPYVVTDFVQGSKVVLDRNPDYWAKDMSEELPAGYHVIDNVETIEFDIIAEPAQTAIALQTGDVDFANNIPETSVEDFLEGGKYSDEYNVLMKPENQYYVAVFNCYEGRPTADVNLRKALCYCIDNSSIYKAVGSTTQPVYAFGSPAYTDFDTSWADLDNYITKYDIQVAKDYLAKSGYNGEELTLVATSTSAFTNLLTMTKAFFDAIGVNSKINLVDSATLTDLSNDPNGFDVYFRAVGGQNLIGSWNMTINKDSSKSQIAGYDATIGYVHDQEMFDLFALTNTHAGHTSENMTKLMQMVFDNAYVTALCVSTKTYVYTKDIAELGIDVYTSYPQMCSNIYYLD